MLAADKEVENVPVEGTPVQVPSSILTLKRSDQLDILVRDTYLDIITLVPPSVKEKTFQSAPTIEKTKERAETDWSSTEKQLHDDGQQEEDVDVRIEIAEHESA